MKGRKMDIELLRLKRRELQVLEEQYEKQRRDKREDIMQILADKTREIEALISECEKLAESADLVFYYSSGYDSFQTEKKENWSESSRYC